MFAEEWEGGTPSGWSPEQDWAQIGTRLSPDLNSRFSLPVCRESVVTSLPVVCHGVWPTLLSVSPVPSKGLHSVFILHHITRGIGMRDTLPHIFIGILQGRRRLYWPRTAPKTSRRCHQCVSTRSFQHLWCIGFKAAVSLLAAFSIWVLQHRYIILGQRHGSVHSLILNLCICLRL